MIPSADTIYALSSGTLPSGVAVIRVSGPGVTLVGTSLFGDLPEPRKAHLKTIRDRNKDVLDQGLVLFFPRPHSFTGEDCLELQVHGGRAVVNAVLDAVGSLNGLRHAEPGEFSRRAFENGKLDLLEIEGLADLLVAETEAQRLLASAHARGGVSAIYQSWARRLTHARAMIEAELDFSDEDDVPGSVSNVIWTDMQTLCAEISTHLVMSRTGSIIRDGYRIAIAGRPNVGKSSLLNALAKQDLAIVTDIAGTTRDVLSVDISLAGFAVKLFDTAGIRETSDPIEQEGVRRAEVTFRDADLILSLSDTAENFVIARSDYPSVLCVGSKIDLERESWDSTKADVLISTQQPNGLDALLDAIQQRLPGLTSGSSFAIPSRRRHVDHLSICLQAIQTALSNPYGLDIQAEYLRQASYALGRITGKIDVEDLLDVIFSEFCIGK